MFCDPVRHFLQRRDRVSISTDTSRHDDDEQIKRAPPDFISSPQLLGDRPAAFRPMSVRYLKDLPTVRPLSQYEQIDSAKIDSGFASARQSEIRPERG